MLPRLRDRLLWPVRTRVRAAITLPLLLLLLASAAWYGVKAWRFRRDREAATEALARYDFPEAQRRLKSCLAWRPNDSEILLLSAEASRRDGLLDDAQAYLDRDAEQAGSVTPEASLQRILILVQGGQVKEHVHALLEYVEVRHPKTEQILEALAMGCVQVYRLDEASFWTKQLLERYPQNPTGRLIDAQTLETLHRRDRALETAQQLVEEYPHHDKARAFLADLLFRRHKYEESAEQCRQLHLRRPKEVGPLVGLARALLALERFDEAEPYLGQLAREYPDDGDALMVRARFLLRQERPAEAEPLLRRAVELAPSDYQVHNELGVCLGRLEKTDESRRHLERAKQIQGDVVALEQALIDMSKTPRDPRPRREAGKICLRNGHEAEGLRWLRGALDVAPNDKATHTILADYYASKGDTKQADVHRARAR